MNTETGESTPLKKLPVTNEPEPHHADLPRTVKLHQNYPNPFNPMRVISYQLPVPSNVTLEVFDMLGRRVAVLVDGPVHAGSHQATFDASGLFSSGVYIYRLATGNVVQFRQMVLVK